MTLVRDRYDARTGAGTYRFEPTDMSENEAKAAQSLKSEYGLADRFDSTSRFEVRRIMATSPHVGKEQFWIKPIVLTTVGKISSDDATKRLARLQKIIAENPIGLEVAIGTARTWDTARRKNGQLIVRLANK